MIISLILVFAIAGFWLYQIATMISNELGLYPGVAFFICGVITTMVTCLVALAIYSNELNENNGEYT